MTGPASEWESVELPQECKGSEAMCWALNSKGKAWERWATERRCYAVELHGQVLRWKCGTLRGSGDALNFRAKEAQSFDRRRPTQRKEGTQMTRNNLPAVYSGKNGKRRSHREQNARMTWRWTCYAVAVMLACYTAAALCLLLRGKDDMILVAIIAGVSAWTALKASTEVPYWWYLLSQ